MGEPTLYLAIVLHMHQPRYNLAGPTQESETARDVFNQTIHPYTYPAEVIRRYEKARVTINFTGSLIEQLDELAAVSFDPRLKGLWNRYREAGRLRRAEFTGCGYFHPIFPLLPRHNQEKQVEAHLETFKATFGGRPDGFWPPELAFSMKLIPLLEERGFKWTIADEPHVINGNKGKKRHELLYHPHYVEYEGHTIVVIPRDRGMSNAQQSGYNPLWLRDEVRNRIQPNNDGTMLLTVATDGENGWFRHAGENAGFWGWFFEPLVYLLNNDPSFQFIKLTTIDEYLKEHPPRDTINVEDGSWNVPGAPDDRRFLKWTEGKQREDTWNDILRTSELVHEADKRIRNMGQAHPIKLSDALRQAWTWLLMAEASDDFWWGGEDWLNRSKICCSKAREKAGEIVNTS